MTDAYAPDRLRSRLRDVRLGRVFRVIHRDHRARPLRAAPAPSRFSDPQGGYAVLYASEAVRCAFWESLGRNRFARRRARELPRSEVEARLVVADAGEDLAGVLADAGRVHRLSAVVPGEVEGEARDPELGIGAAASRLR